MLFTHRHVLVLNSVKVLETSRRVTYVASSRCDRSTEYEMGWQCSTCGLEEKCIEGFGGGNLS